MANITRRANTRLATHLRPGESVQAALLVEPKHTLGLGAIATAIAPRTATRALADQAAARHDEAGGLAQRFPGASAVVAQTHERILVSVSNGLSFAAPTLELPLGGVVIAAQQRRWLGHRLTLAFHDGSAVVVDAQWGQPFDAFRAR